MIIFANQVSRIPGRPFVENIVLTSLPNNLTLLLGTLWDVNTDMNDHEKYVSMARGNFNPVKKKIRHFTKIKFESVCKI